MTWKYKVTVPAGETLPVPASNLLGERHGERLLEAQPSDRLPGVTPGERAASWLASRVRALYWSVTWLVPRSQAGSRGKQLSARCLVLGQRAAVLLSKAGGGHRAAGGVRRALKLGEGGQARFFHRYLLPPRKVLCGGWCSSGLCLQSSSAGK